MRRLAGQAPRHFEKPELLHETPGLFQQGLRLRLTRRLHTAGDPGQHILQPTPETVDALMKLDLAAGVDVEIKL